MVKNKSVEINEHFQRALDLMEKTRSPGLITGKAGTGKSTLLDYFRKDTKRKSPCWCPPGWPPSPSRARPFIPSAGSKPNISLENVKKIAARTAPGPRSAESGYPGSTRSPWSGPIFWIAWRNFCDSTDPGFPGPWGIQMILIGDLYQLSPGPHLGGKTRLQPPL